MENCYKNIRKFVIKPAILKKVFHNEPVNNGKYRRTKTKSYKRKQK